MSSAVTPDTEDVPIDFAPVCACEARMRSACDGQPVYKHQGQRYCVMHHPDENKRIAFQEVLERKLKAGDFNFKGVWFPGEVSFAGTRFEKKVDFMDSTFNGGVDFSETTFIVVAYFARATFNGQTSFTASTFEASAYFRSAAFIDQADFYGVKFGAGAIFGGAVFHSGAVFEESKFDRRADFKQAVFDSYADFGQTEFNAAALFDSSNFAAKSNFNSSKFSDGVYFRQAKFGGRADFSYASFEKSADYFNVTFAARAEFRFAAFGGEVNFSYANFLKRANFSPTTFNSAADFNFCSFESIGAFESSTFREEVNFSSSVFQKLVSFSRATFKSNANFHGAEFVSRASFSRAVFNAEGDFFYCTFSREANFSHATFRGRLRFSGYEGHEIFGPLARLDFQYARAEKPEQISFNMTVLHPHWLINVDARKFAFTYVNWGRLDIKEEIRSLQGRRVALPHGLLSVACRHLAVNAEDNDLYERASEFRYMAMDAQRLEKWRGFVPWRLSWWYWLASGYGERIVRAFAVLSGVCLLFAALYTQVGFARWEPRRSNEKEAMTEPRDDVGEPLQWSRAFTYSLGVMTFQKPEPRPATTAAQRLVILETILGPLQAALLALAIRRKFMR